jgi:hypothetical protein
MSQSEQCERQARAFQGELRRGPLLLGCDATSLGNWYLTLQDTRVVSSSVVKNFVKNAGREYGNTVPL